MAKTHKQYMNTDPKIVERMAFDFTIDEMLTPTLLYIWNADHETLQQLLDEISSRMSNSGGK